MSTKKAKKANTISSSIAAYNKQGEALGAKKSDAGSIVLTMRQVKINNLNFSPQRNGDEKVARVDLSMEVLLEHDDIPQFVLANPSDLASNNAMHALWDEEGNPILMVDEIVLPLKVSGIVKIGVVNGDKPTEFASGVLKKCRLELMMQYKAKLFCQIRVDPDGSLDLLEEVTIREKAKLSFRGSKDQPDGDDSQAELPV